MFICNDQYVSKDLLHDKYGGPANTTLIKT